MKPIMELIDVVHSTMDGHGINIKESRFAGKWECVACGMIYESNLEVCERCGNVQ